MFKLAAFVLFPTFIMVFFLNPSKVKGHFFNELRVSFDHFLNERSIHLIRQKKACQIMFNEKHQR